MEFVKIERFLKECLINLLFIKKPITKNKIENVAVRLCVSKIKYIKKYIEEDKINLVFEFIRKYPHIQVKINIDGILGLTKPILAFVQICISNLFTGRKKLDIKKTVKTDVKIESEIKLI